MIVGIIQMIVFLTGMAVFVSVAYAIVVLPFRRKTRALMFLDLLEEGIHAGRTPEQIVLDAAGCRDRSISRHYDRAASRIQGGMRLSEALSRTPGLVSAQITAMLAVGEKLGDLRKVFPACRKTLAFTGSHVMAGQGYLMFIPFVLNPITWLVLPALILKYQEIFLDLLEGAPLPVLTQFLVTNAREVFVVHYLVLALLLMIMILYCVGPKFFRRFLGNLSWIGDRWTYLLPWHRKRLHRDLSAILAVLLDGGVPEPEAVTMAARCTGNSILIRRASRAVDLLREGRPLAQAIQTLDEAGEFRWRLENAAQGHERFQQALAGWHDALEAKAYQQEQTAAQILSTALLLFNGCLVAVIAIGFFQPITEVIQRLALW